MGYKYAIVTPVKDEEMYIRKTISSVVSQTMRPEIWIIINDGSRDRTSEILEEARSERDWIVLLSTGKSNAKRKPGGESVLPLGMGLLDVSQYDFFVRMDGDISFEHDYFERIFSEFDRDPSLGIASGVCYVPKRGRLVEEKHPRFHTRGPIKAYRVTCFKEIGGLEARLGWDTVDEIKANMLGWRTRSSPELMVIHHRKTQTADGQLKGMLNMGKAAYYVGYHPLFMLVRVVRNMLSPPYLLGGIWMLIGFLSGYLGGQKQINDPSFIHYLRMQQLNRLLCRETIWK